MEEFRQVWELMQTRAPSRVNLQQVASSYLLSGLVRCGTCGKALTGQEAKTGKFAYYVCQTLLKRGRGTCDAPYLNARNFEGMVVRQVKERILTRENIRGLVRMVSDDLDGASHDYKQRHKVLEGELADVQRRLDRLYEVLETGTLSLGDLSPRIQSLRHRQDQLQAAKEEVEDLLAERKASVLDMKDIAEYVDDM